MDTTPLLALIAIFCYLGSATLLTMRMSRQMHNKALPNRQGLLMLVAAAILLHAFTLYSSIVTPAGLNLSFFNVASLTGWLVALLWLLATLRQPLENLGIALLPMVATALAAKIWLSSIGTALLISAGWQLQTHILVSMLAYSLLSIAAAQALLLAIQEHQLRQRKLGGVLRALPPLQTMEALLFKMIRLGFLLLSAALLSGILFLEDIFAQHLVHKTVLSFIAWVVFATLLWGRRRFGWRGRVAIRWTLGGFLTLMLAYFGSKMVLELLLGA